ncbi:MAG: extracellular solute-binding protein [Acidisphaera sp.]|nr:extracellular solute-binding protein [Acidisphaera sp.]
MTALTARARAAAPALPNSPVALSVIDVAGNLALTQPIFENYRKAKPQLVSRMTFTKAPAPEIPGKLKAQESAGRVDIDIVLTGTDALAAGIEQGLYVKLLPDHSAQLPDLQKVYLPAAWKMQSLAQDQGITITYYPSGPLLEYMPALVKQVPATADALLAWAKQNPKKFIYARPANSGPGRTFIMGLPYLLGDKDPKDPKSGWDKTWAYLAELGATVEYYPTGTAAVMKEFGDGTRSMMPTTTGWDINPRVLGVVPKEAKVAALKGFHWVGDAHYLCVPKGIADEKLAVVLDLIGFMLQKDQQAYTYDEGYFYPGPAVADVPITMAPEQSQKDIKEFGRPEYAGLIADNPMELPLDAQALVYAFRRWDEQIGTKTAK